jgi:hypothetical protein
LASAKDPEKTFFEDLPRALGFKDAEIASNADVLKRYVELLQKAIRELRMCYSNLINRLEGVLVDELGLKSKEFSLYKAELEKEKLRTYGRLKVYAVGNGVEHIVPGDEVMIDPSSAARGVVKIPLSEDREVIMVSVFDVAHVW